MRLSKEANLIVFTNHELLKFCSANSIDLSKLKKCSIEKMGKMYVFGYPKENIQQSKGLLDNDIESQPDVVLIMTVDENDQTLSFEGTDNTRLVMNL